MPTKAFDDTHINWRTIDGIDHLAYHICEVDAENGTVDLLFKFDANSKIALHNHMVPYRTLILQGELRIYRANGELKEIRPVGSYVSAGPGESHTEGGGDQDVIAFFSNRNVKDVVYEILDENREVVATFGIPEFSALLEEQKAAGEQCNEPFPV
ncbi:cupin domain-containing protein [Methyloligella solikamskensis]|uniref:Cupin domain-containing protein n=1 Tax=Methyloligella solikamskensis TaxID=1177756 RepID=A0ABW3JBZ9_9HYPH